MLDEILAVLQEPIAQRMSDLFIDDDQLGNVREDDHVELCASNNVKSLIKQTRKVFYFITRVGSSPKKNVLSASMSWRTLRSSWPMRMISSGVWTPMPVARTFFRPCEKKSAMSTRD